MSAAPTVTAAQCGRHPRPTDTAAWRAAKRYGAESKPSKRAYGPGSWVSWTAPTGQQRTGVVTRDDLTVRSAKRAAEVGEAKDGRTRAAVVPADGGETLPLALPHWNDPAALVKDGGRWRPVSVAHHLSANQSTPLEVSAA
ncbi:hypothetical protein GCM10009716_33460 [Streptomyces sodiiphilus]|uniref:Uncharacterized protein n=1 Tax=Streptomyces sodiiphilus TaxID=226217 RepID=A0ABP5AT99_9ACTN